MTLQEQIDSARAEIRTDSYSMSIGEWISLYESGEIHIHPEFQRFFRWTQFQKSRLVESILLGIPIPPVFVSQRQDGVWDVIDGLQRLSTIYQLVGILENEEGERLPPLELTETRYLPDLEGKHWKADNPEESLTQPQRLLIKRAKIDVSIVLKESDEEAKYELFQRLNTGGTPLSDQEVRNSVLVMLNRPMYRWLKGLADTNYFQETVALTDRALEEQYDKELVLRFLVFRSLDQESLEGIGDINDYLSNKMTEFAQENSLDMEEEEEAFNTTFRLLHEATGSDSFRRYDHERERFVGGFLVSAFETIAIGIGYNYRHFREREDFNLQETIQDLWANDQFRDNSGAGVRASSRLPVMVSLGRELFQR